MPSSSAHCVTGSTTSASRAVSEGTKSQTTSRSSAPSRRMRSVASGTLTTRFEPWTNSARIPSRFGQPGEELHRRHSGARAGRLGDAPHGGDVGARCRVVDGPVAGQLVGLLAVLAAALPVALAGDAAVAAAHPSGQAEGQREVDRGGDRVGALRVLLDAAPGQDVRAGAAATGGGRGEQPGRLPELRRRDTGVALDPLRPPHRHRTPDLVGPGDALGEVAGVGVPCGEDDVQDAEQEHEVGARQGLEVQAGAVLGEDGGRGAARVHDDQPTLPARAGEVLDQRRHGLGGLPPTSRIACAPPRSVSGKGSPRSMPKAALPAAAAEDMQKRPL